MLCKQQPQGRQSLFDHSNKNMNMSVFFKDCPESLNCCRLFKIYTSYIILKCRSVEMINIPWFLVPHFYLLSVQSYKRLKLRAFKDDYFAEPVEDNFLSSDSILSRTSLCPYFVSWKIYLFTSKKIAFMSSTEMIIPFRIIFLRLRHEKRCIFWN